MDKITIERETLNAAMMALEYLLEASPVMTTKHRDAYSTAARLRAALAAQPAEAQQEPVAWAVYKGDECLRVHEKREWAEDWARAEAHFGSVGPYHIRELFAAQPAQPAEPVQPLQGDPVTLADVLDALNVFNKPRPSEGGEPWTEADFISVKHLPDFINIIAVAWFSRTQPAEPVQPVCSLCQGTGVVDDGEINCYPNGEPYENGPVKCVKDCPRCANKPPAEPVQRMSDAGIEALAGKHVGNSKLTRVDVISARRLRAKGETFQSIADRFSVDIKTIMAAIKGKQWSHVIDPAAPKATK